MGINKRLDIMERQIEEMLLTVKRLDQEKISKLTEIAQESMDEMARRMEASMERMNFVGGMLYVPIYSIFSFCVNEAVRRQGGMESSARYGYYGQLHRVLRAYDACGAEKCRIGKPGDGGYVMIKPFSTEKVAYSFGISDDVSWDMEMASDGYEIFQYDHTIDRLPEDSEAFHWKRTGITGGEETDGMKRFETLLKDNGHWDRDGMLLKMDIEGAEWDVFRTIPEGLLGRFDQIVVEVHGLNDMTDPEKKIKALKRLTADHAVVHVHGNNFQPAVFCGDLITPDVIELTLVHREKYDLKESAVRFPEGIDQANRPGAPDIWLGKW